MADRRKNRLGILLDKARGGVDYPVSYGAERFQFRYGLLSGGQGQIECSVPGSAPRVMYYIGIRRLWLEPEGGKQVPIILDCAQTSTSRAPFTVIGVRQQERIAA